MLTQTASTRNKWEGWRDLTIGLIGVILGWLLTVGWDVYKYRTESEHREQAVLRATADELSADLTILNGNIDLLKQKTQPVLPLRSPTPGYWYVLRLEPPKRLSFVTLRRLRTTSFQLDELAELIRSRESYKIIGQALTTYKGTLAAYDVLLVQKHSAAIESVRGVLSEMPEANSVPQ